MYMRPSPTWNRNAAATNGFTGGYLQAMPGANQPQAAASRNIPGNQTFSTPAPSESVRISQPTTQPNVQQQTRQAAQNNVHQAQQTPPPNMQQAAQSSMQQQALQPPQTNMQQSVNAPQNRPAQQVMPQRVQPAQTQNAQRDASGQQQSAKRQNNNSSATISQKIWKINGRNKVVDFNSKLTMAYINDFANIHGCGGSGHAGNSTIGIVICDYTHGTNEKSITVKFNLDVEDMGILYEAAMAARLGQLKPDPGINVAWISHVQNIVDSWKVIQKSQDGSRPIPAQALNAINSALNDARAATNAQLTTPLFSYTREKNNPYKVNNGLAPCSKVSINYTPYRKDGAPSNYPWYIGVENFDAPLKTGSNGASSHNANQAVNKKSAFINLSNDDFCAAMVAIQRFVSIWEHRAIPMIEEAYRRIDAARAEKEQEKAAGYDVP